MTPDLPIMPLLTGPPWPVLPRTRVRNRRPALVWTVRAGTILTLLDVGGVPAPATAGATCPRPPQGFLTGRGWLTRSGWPGVFRHEPPAGSGLAVRNAFWSDVTAAAQAGLPVVVVARTLAPADAHAQRTLVVRGGRVLARASRAELQARLNAQRVTARSDTLRCAQVLAVPGVRSVRRLGHELHVTADAHAGVAVALRTLDPHAQVCTRALTLRDVFQGLQPQAAGPFPCHQAARPDSG